MRYDIGFGENGEIYVYYWDTAKRDGSTISLWMIPGTWED